jgi:hypothetical protein
MMDVHEAIKGLDGYAEALASLSTLLGAMLFEEKSDERETLLAQIKEKQNEGKSIALMIMKDIHTVGTKADGSGDLTGISAAMQRYVAADHQASEALMIEKTKANPPTPIRDAVDRFTKSAGLIPD